MKRTLNRTQACKQQSGFTVVELMIALAVAAILLSTAIPSFSAVVDKNHIGAATEQLYVSLNAARSEALKRRSSVRVCPSADSTTCRNDGDWSDGWVIFEDLNSNNSPDAAEIIRLVDGLEGEINVQTSTAISAFVQFQPTGAAIGSGGNNGEFRFCHSDSSASSRLVNVSPSGGITSLKRTQTDCDAS